MTLVSREDFPSCHNNLVQDLQGKIYTESVSITAKAAQFLPGILALRVSISRFLKNVSDEQPGVRALLELQEMGSISKTYLTAGDGNQWGGYVHTSVNLCWA